MTADQIFERMRDSTRVKAAQKALAEAEQALRDVSDVRHLDALHLILQVNKAKDELARAQDLYRGKWGGITLVRRPE